MRNTMFQADLLREADCVSSSNSRTTQQLHEAAASAGRQQQLSSGRNSSSLADHARPRSLSAQQSGQGRTVGHGEGRYNGVPDGFTLCWVYVVPTKVKLRVRVSPSAYSIRLYSSRHDEETHNHTFDGQQRNRLQGERDADIQAYMHSFTTSCFFSAGLHLNTKRLYNTTKSSRCM